MLNKEKSITTLSGSYSIKVTGYDWGPAVDKVILIFDKEVVEVSKDLFNITEVKNWDSGIESFERIVTNSYLSDEKGNKVKGASSYITIELKVEPDIGNPFLCDCSVERNNWTDPYYLKISLDHGKRLKCVDGKIDEINIKDEYVNRYLGIIEKFKEDIYKDGDISLSYAHYEPKNDKKKKPLIIWLHGSCEGGIDTTISTLGNKVGALLEDNIQNKFNGAYVLVPQSPTIWMDCTGNDEYTTNGDSIYIEALLNLIKSYVSSNSDIDTNRIYIGGCSNGGYMTMAMILKEPEYFAAAYPVCEAYSDSWISDEKINSIKNMPIWFTYAKNDKIVDPKPFSEATIERLIKAGNSNLHTSVFDNVVDTSGLYKDEEGNLYEYDGHLSWIYVFNDECKDGEDSLWDWLAKQSKV